MFFCTKLKKDLILLKCLQEHRDRYGTGAETPMVLCPGCVTSPSKGMEVTARSLHQEGWTCTRI